MIRKHAKRAPRPIPQKVRARLLAGAVLMVVIAAVANVGHTQEHASHYGQRGIMAWVIAFIPDGILILSIMRLRYDRSSLAAWAGVAGAAGLVAWASVSTTTVDGPGAKIVSLVALIAAIIATGLLHGGPEAETLEQFVARTERAVREAHEAARLAAHEAAESIRAVHAEAHDVTARAVAEARTALDRAGALEVELTAERAAHAATAEAAREAAREGARAAVTAGRTGGARKRTAGARKASARTTNGPDDLHRRSAARSAFEESVRTGNPLSNRDLAAAIYGVEEPDPKQVRAASARASEWTRAVSVDAKEAGAR